MGSYSKNDIILVRYPFSDLSGSKVRPAIVVSVPHVSQDVYTLASPSAACSRPLSPTFVEDSNWEPDGLCEGRTYVVSQGQASESQPFFFDRQHISKSC